MTEENLQFVSHSVFASPDNKVLTNDPGQQDSALPKVFKLVFVHVTLSSELEQSEIV